MARPPARGPIRQHNIPIVEPSATSAFVAPISARSAPQVARSVSKIGTLSARRHDAERARPKTRYQKSASETEARDGDNEAQSETRRPGGIQRMPAFRADFREPPADNGGDRTGWLGRQDSNLGMAESKSAALPLGYAPSQGPQSRPDDSDEGRTDQRPLRLRAPGARGYISASGKYRSVAQPGSAPRSGRGGRRFKSCHSDQ